jgi:hypothetical protein
MTLVVSPRIGFPAASLVQEKPFQPVRIPDDVKPVAVIVGAGVPLGPTVALGAEEALGVATGTGLELREADEDGDVDGVEPG